MVLQNNHRFSHHGCLSSSVTEHNKLTSTSSAVAPPTATPTTTTLTVGSSFGTQAGTSMPVSPWTSTASSGPSSYASVGGASVNSMGGASSSDVGGASPSGSSQGEDTEFLYGRVSCRCEGRGGGDCARGCPPWKLKYPIPEFYTSPNHYSKSVVCRFES